MKICVKLKMKNIGRLLFYFAWIIYLTAYTILGASEIQGYISHSGTVLRYLELLVAIILLVKIVFIDKICNISDIGLLVILAITAVSGMKCGNYEIMVAAFFAFGMKNIKIDKFIRFDVVIRAALLIIIVGLSLVGVLSNYCVVTTHTVKYAYGFWHPNLLGIYTSTVLIEWCYIRYDKFSVKELLAILLVIYVLNQTSVSRASMISMFTAIILIFAIKKMPRITIRNSVGRFFIKYAEPISLIASYIAALYYNPNNSIWAKLNDMFTNRIKWASVFLDEYGVSIIGQKVKLVSTRQAITAGTTSRIIDCSYVKIGIMFGVLVLAIISVAYVIFNSTLLRKKYYELLVMSIFYIVLGVMENAFYIPAYNITLLFALRSFANTSSNFVRRKKLKTK